jgi:hypothetical protein
LAIETVRERATDEPAGPVGGGRGRRALGTAAWMLLAVVIAGGVLAHWYADPRRIASSGDSYFYMRQALMFTGVSKPEATRIASDLTCQDINRSIRASHIKGHCDVYVVTGISPRYERIFATRPGYPLFAAPFVAVLGAWSGMVAATVVLALIAVVLAFLAVYLATGYRLGGFVAALTLVALPSGFWMTRLLTEAGLMGGYLAVILGTLLTWRGRHRLGLAVIGLSLVWLFAVKSAGGAAAALVVAGASVLALIGPRGRRRGPLLSGALAVVLLIAWTVFSALTRQPGLYETIQDYATTHFRRPDIADPYQWWWRQNQAYWPYQWQKLLQAPATMIGFFAAAAVLIVALRREAALFVLIGLTGVAMQLAHPYASQWDRMNMAMWVPVAAAAGLVAGWLGHQLWRLVGRLRRAARPAESRAA